MMYDIVIREAYMAKVNLDIHDIRGWKKTIVRNEYEDKNTLPDLFP